MAAVIDNWFTTGESPALLGNHCPQCATVAFPPIRTSCPNPACGSTDLGVAPLPRTGTIWSYTTATYQPPAPYVPTTDPFEPFAIAAVELEGTRMVVLGQVADGYGVEQLRVGAPVELVVEPLDAQGQLVWRWRPV
jgi:uncharacterized OB-fold protein